MYKYVGKYDDKQKRERERRGERENEWVNIVRKWNKYTKKKISVTKDDL